MAVAATPLPPEALRGAVTVTIVDVGHGSCVSVSDGVTTSLIDTGAGAAVLNYLESESISELHSVVVSHSDSDHLGGLVALLAEARFGVQSVFVNADADKESDLWKDLVYVLDDRNRSGSLELHVGLAEGDVIDIGIPNAELHVVAPRARLMLIGPGGKDRRARLISSNSASAVLAIKVNGVSEMLLPGDIDHVGYAHLEESGVDIRSRFLVLPHHGGHCGTEAQTRQMIRSLCEAVGPERVFVSNGRGRFKNPRPEVIREVLNTLPGVDIACTQLSDRCAVEIPEPSESWRTPLPLFSAGSEKSACCGGTMRAHIGVDSATRFSLDDHKRFVSEAVPEPMCR